MPIPPTPGLRIAFQTLPEKIEIWISPADYTAALADTPFDPHTGEWTPRSRSRERDTLVRERVRRRRLFTHAEVTP